MRGAALAAAIAALSVVPSAVSHPLVSQQTYSQPEKRDDTVSSERAAAVKEAFQHAFDGYMKYAYPNDDLRPVTNTSGNSRNGWGASAVDALSTALIMRDTEAVDIILKHIAGIDYSQTNSQVSLFETTIRYLGGMLSGYDLIKGPLSDVPSNHKYVEALKAKSVELADVLKYAFDSKTGIPSNGLNIGDKTTDGSTTNGIATIGTLVLEWTRLSDITGDPDYADRVQKGEEWLLKPQPDWAQPFPGLIGTRVDINTGLFQDNSVSWGASDDSFYEYLIKMYVYDKEKFGFYKDRWVAAAESTIKHLKSSPSSRPDITFVATWNNGTYGLNSQHLTCFDGGNFILGGQVLGRDDLVQFGLDLVNGCHETYVETATRIGPEQFSWGTDTKKIPTAWKDFYDRAGFYITSSGYNLRPEVIESYYYAYRATLDPKYQDWAWDAFVAINKTTRTGSGFSAITDVNNPTGGSKTDYQESFLFAEVMKYSYIIHAGDGDWQVATNGRNKFVYNTEAHPVMVKG